MITEKEWLRISEIAGIRARRAAGDITTADIDPDAVTGDAIADDAVGAEHIEDDAVLRSHLADAAGMTHQTRAALFEPGVAGSMQRCSFSFDPTNTTARLIRFKRRGLSRPATSETRSLCGDVNPDQPNVAYTNAAGVYTLYLRENTSTLASYVWTDDFEEHEWSFETTASASTISLDGSVVATGSAPSFVDTAFTFKVGAGGIGATLFTGDHATYRDFEVIDPATATNKVFLRLDEPSGGPYYNAYLRVGDPLYDATNTSAIQIATTGTDTARPKSVEINTVSGNAAPVIAGGRSTHMRVAAFSGLGDHATAGYFGAISWAPTGTPAFNVEFDCRRSLTQAADVTFGRIAAECANINITAAGVVQARVNTTNICTTTAVALPPDGRTRRVRVEFRDSGADVTAAIYVNRQLVVSGTLAATQFWSVAATYCFGGASSGARRWSGSIFNLLLEDLNSAANSGFYLMDEPRGSTTYANTYPSGTLAGLTINGYVSSCGVESADGRGRPWQLGDGAPLVYSVRQNAAADYTGATFANHVWDTEISDPTASITTQGTLTAPCAGKVTTQLFLSLQATTLTGADTINAYIRANSTIVATARVYVPAAAQNFCIALSWSGDIGAGQTVQANELDSLVAGDTWRVESGSTMSHTFTPTPVAG